MGRFGHRSFSAEKACDPASRRRAPAFKSPGSSFRASYYLNDCLRNLAEMGRFELPIEFPLCRFSKAVPSTSQPHFQIGQTGVHNSTFCFFHKKCYSTAHGPIV